MLCDSVLGLEVDDAKLVPLERSMLANFRIWKQIVQSNSPMTADQDPTESCEICHQSVRFESEKWATCTAGHAFCEQRFESSSMRIANLTF